jgi:hypothetical protein
MHAPSVHADEFADLSSGEPVSTIAATLAVSRATVYCVLAESEQRES